jgi:hypothetical protein
MDHNQFINSGIKLFFVVRSAEVNNIIKDTSNVDKINILDKNLFFSNGTNAKINGKKGNI